MNIIEKTYKWDGSLSKRKVTKRIVLHHAEASRCTADQIHEWHLKRGWCGIGYHFFVTKDGIIYRGRPEDVIGSHAKGANADSIGICAEGKYMTETMPNAQKEVLIELVAYLKEKYNIELVQRHKDVTATDCPGTNYPFDEIVDGAVKKEETKSKINQNVLALQKALNKDLKCGLTEDGLLGPKTKAQMKKIVIKKPTSGSDKKYPNINKFIQGKVNVTQDGYYGQKTKDAVKAYQKANKLTVDGIVGYNTLMKMVS